MSAATFIVIVPGSFSDWAIFCSGSLIHLFTKILSESGAYLNTSVVPKITVYLLEVPASGLSGLSVPSDPDVYTTISPPPGFSTVIVYSLDNTTDTDAEVLFSGTVRLALFLF